MIPYIFILLVFAVTLLIVSLTVFKDNMILTYMSSALFVLIGVVGYTEGFLGINDVYTRSLAFIFLFIGLYISFVSSMALAFND